MKIVKWVFAFLTVYLVLVFFLFSFDVLWMSPDLYEPEKNYSLNVPIMSMYEYDSIVNSHPRPYIYTINSSNSGSVHIVGLNHTKDPNHPHLDSLINVWNSTSPSVALIEGRLGFLFSWIQNPIEVYGESGLTAKLAKEKDVELYSWEPSRVNEVSYLLKNYTPKQLALFFSFRPYFSNVRYGIPDDPEKKLQSYLEDRTNYDGIRNVYKNWSELEQAWEKDFPNINWRTYSDEHGWPDGYLTNIANDSNISRDHHLINSILSFIEKGEIVFVVVGVSHAPRIEATLRSMIK